MNSSLRKRLFGTWNWKRPFYSIGFIYVTFFIIVLFAADTLIFPAPQATYSEQDEWVTLIKTDKDERIACFYLPAEEGRPTLLWSHGNAEELSSLKDFLPYIAEDGYGVFAYDYLGYGISDGSPTEEGCYRSITAAYDHLVKNIKIDPASVIIFGQSVGSGPSVWLGQDREHAGMILVSPFKTAFTTVTKVPIFPNDRFLNIKRIKNYAKPLLVIHGVEDEIIPFSHGQAIFDSAKSENKKLIAIEGAGHNDIYPVGLDEILRSIASFTQSIH